MRAWKITLAVCMLLLAGAVKSGESEQNWTNYVRIGAYGLAKNDADAIVKDAQASQVFGIEVDNDIPGTLRKFSRPYGKVERDSRGGKEGARRRKQSVRLHRRNGMHHRERRSKAQHSVVKDHPGLAAKENNR